MGDVIELSPLDDARNYRVPVRGSGRPKAYKLADGTRVPGVTTIVGRFKDSGALIRWAYKMGLDGKDMDAERDSAASAGTLAHTLIEAKIHGANCEPPTDGYEPQQIARARNALARFTEWIASKRIRITHTEVPLISEEHRYGGTLDAIATGPNGETILCDWKTSASGPYPEYLAQVAAYALLVEECMGLHVQSALLLRFDKEAEVSSEHQWGESVLASAQRAFLLFREAYEMDKDMKRWCK